MPWDFEGFGWAVGLFKQGRLILERESERAGELKCGYFGKRESNVGERMS